MKLSDFCYGVMLFMDKSLPLEKQQEILKEKVEEFLKEKGIKITVTKSSKLNQILK